MFLCVLDIPTIESRQANTDVERLSVEAERKRRTSDEYQGGNKRIRAVSASSGASYATVNSCSINVMFTCLD